LYAGVYYLSLDEIRGITLELGDIAADRDGQAIAANLNKKLQSVNYRLTMKVRQEHQ